MRYWCLLVCLVATALSAEHINELFDEGLKAFNESDYEKAVTCFKQIDDMSPNKPEVLFNLATCYISMDDIPAAIQLLYRVVDLQPTYTKAYYKLIELLKKQKAKHELESVYKRLVEHNDQDVQAHITLACKHKEAEEFDAAIKHYLKAIELAPYNKSLCFQLAIVYTLIGQTEKAISLYDEIIAAHPENVTALYNKAYALKMQGSCDEAIDCYCTALHLKPDHTDAQFALGMAYLNKGDYEQGWTQHEQYLKRAGRNGDNIRQYLQQGTTSGKTILLRPEGGLGDTINFIRYASELKKYGFNTIVAVPKPLYNLCKDCPGIDHLVAIGENVPQFDDHTTLMSIPAILHMHEHQLPTFAPYIFPNKDLIAYWGEQLKHDTNLKVGICWEASVYNDSSRPPAARRGMPLEALYILSEIDGVSLYSLQQQDGVEQLQDLPPYIKIHVFDETFDTDHGSFMDTAAVMQHLDLIISVDTAIAHLAGAMGRPVWLMLPWATDWRWLAHQTSSPWYPTMRIFKQPKPFDWESVVHEIFWTLTGAVS